MAVLQPPAWDQFSVQVRWSLVNNTEVQGGCLLHFTSLEKVPELGTVQGETAPPQGSLITSGLPGVERVGSGEAAQQTGN